MKEPSSGSALEMEEDTGAMITDEVESANPPPTEGENIESGAAKEILAKVVAVNQHSHLEGVVRPLSPPRNTKRLIFNGCVSPSCLCHPFSS